MKTSKYILASIFALVFATSAHAQTVIRITGSTAYRSAVHQAILNILTGTATFGYSSTTLGASNQAIFTGTTISGGTSVIIKTSFSGSVGGLLVLTKNLTVPDAAIGVAGGWLVNTTPQSVAPGTASVPANFDAPTTADASFSDSFQGSTIANSPVLVGANGFLQGVVGVVPFEWVRNVGSPATITNVTNLLAQAALGGGVVLSQFSGLAADENTFVEVFGRDSDSGTRLEAFAETGFGILNSPTQYQPLPVGGATITAINPWPAQLTDGISYPTGHEGFSSGSGVAAALDATGSQTAANFPGVIIGYLGITDAATAVAGGGTALPYNGVAFSAAAVQNGTYSFWSYEHLYYRSTFAAPGKTVVDLLAANVHNVATTAAGIQVITMLVGRSVEGGVITFGNPY